jgi:pimeloyl-ACP methyl ester carboxylesterase
MSIEGMGDMMAEIISKEVNAGEKVILIGHSMGGYISLAMAERHADIICALGLFHSSAYADSEEKIATRRKGIQFIQEHGAGEFLKTAIPNLFSPQSKEKNPQIINELIEQGNNFSVASLVSYYEAMIKRPDRTYILKNMNIPFLFLLGKFDTAIPLKDGLSLCHMPELSYIHVLHKSGHMGMLEEADLTNRILLEFISEN